MPNIRLSDARTTIASLAEAAEVFNELAVAEIGLAVADARAEKRIAAVKSRHDRDTAEARVELATLKERLNGFILSNRALFESPRCQQTSYGSFGLRSVSDLLVTDPEALLQAILDRGYEDCLKRVQVPVKAAVRDRLAAGESFPGVALRAGDTVVCNVRKELVAQAVEAADSAA